MEEESVESMRDKIIDRLAKDETLIAMKNAILPPLRKNLSQRKKQREAIGMYIQSKQTEEEMKIYTSIPEEDTVKVPSATKATFDALFDISL